MTFFAGIFAYSLTKESWVILKHLVITTKVFLLLWKFTQTKSAACWQPTVLFWHQSSRLSKDWLVVLAGRKLLTLRKEISLSREPEGCLLRGEKQQLQNYFYKHVAYHTLFFFFLINSQSDMPHEIRQGKKAPVIPSFSFPQGTAQGMALFPSNRLHRTCMLLQLWAYA